MLTKEGSTKFVNLMTPGAGGFMITCGHISHYSEYALSSTLSIYSILIAIVLGVIMLLFYVIVYSLYDGAI